jgi:iron complex outermembrane recepter protein
MKKFREHSMTVSKFRALLAASVAVGGLNLGTSSIAIAQDSADSGEIIVTAQRREQALQDVGIAIAAFSGDQLADLGVTVGSDIARLTPGVAMSGSSAGQNAQFTIRGVVQNDFNDSIEAPVAVYIDEGYVPFSSGQVFGTFDLERVEVLKGPQGTLFGRNATGGLVHFVTRKPTKELDGFIDLTYGRFDNIRAEAAVGGPLGDMVSVRLSFVYDEYDDLMENLYPQGLVFPATAPGGPPPGPEFGQDIGGQDTIAGRVQVQFDPTENLSIRLTGALADTNFSIGPYTNYATTAVRNSFGQLINTVAQPQGTPDGLGYVAPRQSRYVTSSDFAPGRIYGTKVHNGMLHINYDTDAFSVTAITDYKKFDKVIAVDVESGPVNFVNFSADIETDSIAQELRIAGETGNLNWVVGGYYLNTDANLINGFLAPPNSLFSSVLGFGALGVDLLNDVRLKTKSYSAFGQVEYSFTEQFKFILGARIIREKQNFDWSSYAVLSERDYFHDPDGTVLVPDGALQTLTPFSDDRSKTLWAGKAQIEYRPNDDLMFYFGVNRGVKGGAYNVTLPDGAPPLQPDQVGYGPEELVSYEGGIKSTWLDGKVQLNASAYYYDYNNYQAFSFVGITGIVSNEKARNYGFEVDLALRPTDGLSIQLGVAYMNAKVKDLAVAPAVYFNPATADPTDLLAPGAIPNVANPASLLATPAITRDVRPSFTPKYQFTGQISYEFDVEQLGGSLTLFGDFSYASSFFHNIQNFQSHRLEAAFITNFAVQWRSEDDHWKVRAFLNNAFDERNRNIGFDLTGLCGCSEESYGKPRWWGFTVGYKY